MILQSDFRADLSDKELSELEAFLTSRCVPVPHGGMNLSMLNGYLTADISGPEFPAPNAWLPQVWGREEDGGETTLVFTSIDEAKHVHVLVFRRMSQISGSFERGEMSPIFFNQVLFGIRKT